MRRLGYDATYRLNFREFDSILRLSIVKTIENEFMHNLNNNRVNLAKTHQKRSIRKAMRDCENGKTF